MSTLPSTTAARSEQDPINQKLLELSKAAMSMFEVAELEAQAREALCLTKSPHMCLVV